MSSMFCTKMYSCKNANWCARDYNPKSDEPECFEFLTNADRIRSMTDEELAEWIMHIVYCCGNDYCGKSCPLHTLCWSKTNASTLDWLKQEVKE